VLGRYHTSKSCSPMDLIYKIMPALLWHQAQDNGVFAGTPADIADGFIHFSLSSQLEVTASKWFNGQEDLMLIAADSAKLGEKLRFEPSRGGALFPHLYGSLPLDCVMWAKPLPIRPDGRHDFAGLLERITNTAQL
jgi:uncharacterized protein (DUF952 family)